MLTETGDWLSDALWQGSGNPLRRLPDGRAFPQVTDSCRDAAIAHAQDDWPNESCGLLIENGSGVIRYVRAPNVHISPREHFSIPRSFIAEVTRGHVLVGIVHSHPQANIRTGAGLCPSEADWQTQREWRVPFYITALSPRGTFMDFFGWGDELPAPPLRERQFRHAVTDCFALYRHAYHRVTGVVLPDRVRSLSWWDTPGAENPITAGVYAMGFRDVDDDLRPGDGLLFSMTKETIQHCGLYLGGDLFLHHLHGRLSTVDPLPMWARFLRKRVRFAPGAENEERR